MDIEDGGILGTNHDADTGSYVRGTRAIESHDWYMFHGNAAHTGVADPTLFAPDTNATAWTFYAEAEIEASTAVVGDMVYFATTYDNSIYDCMIYGINETTGDYWNFTDMEYGGENSYRSSPAIADIPGAGHMLFIGSIGMGATLDFAYGLDATPDDNGDGVIDDLDNDEGIDDPSFSNYDLIWRTTLADYSSTSSPLVAYIPSLSSYVVYVVGGETLHALNAADGDYIWNFTTGGYITASPALGYTVFGVPVVYIASDDGFLYALDAAGFGGFTTVKWQYNLGGWVDSSPTIADDRLFIGTYTNPMFYCLDATPDDNGDTLITEIEDEGFNDPPGANYDVIWTYDVGDIITCTPAVHDSKVFITAYDGFVYALQENTTQSETSIVWSYFTGSDLGFSSPTVADGKVFVGSKSSNKVMALNETGAGGTTTLIWEYTTGGPISASPSIANGKVYIGSEDRNLYVFGAGGDANQKPYPPKLYSPLNTQVVTSPSPRFDWSDAYDLDGYIISYEITIDNNADYSSPEYVQIDITESHYFPTSISDGTYFWHVRAKDNKGAHSIWSGSWTFTIDTANDPPQLTVVSPNGGEVWAGVHDLYWYAFDDENEPMSFDLWLSNDSGASYDIPLASNLSSHVREWRFETALFLDGTNYRIKVNATDFWGLKTVDTSDADFAIDNGQGVIYDDWPQFHRTANNTGHSPSQVPETNMTDWIFDTEREIDASPAVFGEMVFIGNHNGTFYALNETTGAVIWRYDHTDIWSWCDTSPAVGYVPQLNTYAAFFGLTITDGYNFFAMDIDGLSDGDDGIPETTLPANLNQNGDVLWAYKAESSGASSSSPTVFGETVYICFYETEIGLQNSSLWAFDINGYFDGDEWLPDDTLSPDFRSADVLWTFNTNAFDATSSPAVENIPGLGDVVFVGTTEGYYAWELDPNLYALDADPFDDLVDQGIADPPGAFYDLIWEAKLDDYLFSSPAVAYGNVYVGTYSSPEYNPDNSGSLYCLDGATGTIKWNYEVGANDDIYASPAVWNDMVFVPVRTYDQSLYAFDATPEDGIDEGYDDPASSAYDIIWVQNLYASKISSSPAVANGRVFIGAGWEYSWGEIYCLDAIGDGTGGTTEIWRYTTSDFVYGSPSIANGCLYVTDINGYVYKFGAMNGPDLMIDLWDVVFEPPTPQENGTSITIQAKVTNLGNIDAANVMVRFFDDLNENGIMDPGEQIGTDASISLIPAYGDGIVSIPWTGQPAAYHNIYVVVDPMDSIVEIMEYNNEAWTFFAVEPIIYQVDSIIIRTEPNGGGDWVGDKVYSIGAEDTFYCAGYNSTSGSYVRDVEAVWWSNNTLLGTVTTPGVATAFNVSNTNSGVLYVEATYSGIYTNASGLITILPPEVDTIIIRDESNGLGQWVADRVYNVGAEDYFYCAGYNSTSGSYVRDVEAVWWSNNTLLGTVTTPGVATAFNVSDINSGVLYVMATYAGIYTNESGRITVLSPTIDYILIRDQADGSGEEVGDMIYGVGEEDAFFCAGYNTTAGFLSNVLADWVCNDTDIASVTSPGINTTFTASIASWGAIRITATYNFLSDTTGIITIMEPSLDYIVIVDKPDNMGPWVNDRTYGAGGTDTFYCAGYNDTSGYIDDFSAQWSSSNSAKGAVTTPGVSSNFTASTSSFGGVYVTAFYNGKTNQTGKLTVLVPTIDYLLIRSEPENGGEVIDERTYAVGDTDTYYCAGYNSSSGFLGGFSAEWVCSDDTIGQVTPTGESTTFTASDTKSGSITVTASYGGLEAETGLLTVIPPTVDYIVIRDDADNQGEIVGSRSYCVGGTDRFYCAGYNDTAGYLGDFSSSWESSKSSVGQVNPSGKWTTFTASSTNSGTLTVTATYGGKTDGTGILTVLTPTADYVIIRDANGDSVEGLVVGLDDSILLYSAGYNVTAGFIGNISVLWESSNSSVAIVGGSGSSTTFSSSDDTPGETLVSVKLQGKTMGFTNIKVVDDVFPSADAGEDQTIKKGTTVQLDGTGSEDNVGIESYAWTFYEEGVLVTLNGQLSDYEFTKPGSYDIMLTVTDGSGNTGTDTVTIIVEAEDADAGFALWWLLVLLILIAVIAILLFLFLAKKKKKNSCRNCGQAFYPQDETNATTGLCPNCASRGAQGQQSTSQVSIPSPQGANKKTKRITCPSCKKNFDFEAAGYGMQSVKCPHCGTAGQMKL